MRTVVVGGGGTYLKQNLFHSRMVRPVVGSGGPACLKPIEGVIHEGQKKKSTREIHEEHEGKKSYPRRGTETMHGGGEG